MAVAADFHRDFLIPEDILYPRQRTFSPDGMRLFFCCAYFSIYGKLCQQKTKKAEEPLRFT
jgi:hypothetical protein